MGLNKTKITREPIEWNRLTAIIATIVVVFFFTRSAPFPASTFWELAIARDFNPEITNVFFPETIMLKIVDPTISSISAIFSGLLGLKAVYHIIYFIICSSFCFWIFKNKEPLPGLIGLSVYAFSMQTFLNLRILLTLVFIMGILFLLDQGFMKNKFGILFIPVIAAASSIGLNTLLLISPIICYVLSNKKYNISLIVCACFGGLFFPEGFVALFDNDSIFNWNFMPESDLQILYVLSGIFLLVNLISLSKSSSQDVPYLLFYAITGFFALMQPTVLPVFLTIGLFVLIKLYSDQRPLPISFQGIGLLFITTIVYVYLFINPFGIKLNPAVRGQLGKELTPIMEGYENSMKIEKQNIGELIWKGMIRFDNQDKIRELLTKPNLEIIRTARDEYKIVEQKESKKEEL